MCEIRRSQTNSAQGIILDRQFVTQITQTTIYFIEEQDFHFLTNINHLLSDYLNSENVNNLGLFQGNSYVVFKCCINENKSYITILSTLLSSLSKENTNNDKILFIISKV